jgi:hypothetical protein
MELPKNPNLPFFAYGIFKKGELAFLSIMDLVKDVKLASVKGELRLRDGLPILNLKDQAQVEGSLIYFKDNHSVEAYEIINGLEPDKQYIWMETEPKQNIKCNYLVGKSPMKGSVEDQYGWDGKNDPLFTDALKVIRKTLDDNRGRDEDIESMFKLQMAYLLLWSAIERYASLRYRLGSDAWQKIKRIAQEDIFKKLLHENVEMDVEQYRQVQRADDPTEDYKLNPNKPKESLLYYYQVRNNISHRGKGAKIKDHPIVEKSLHELLNIFEGILCNAFEISSNFNISQDR